MNRLPTTAKLAYWALLPASLLCAADPPWYNQPQFFNIGGTITWGTDPLLAQVPFTGQAWGVGLPSPGSPDVLRREVAAWPRPYFATKSLVALNPTTGPIPAEWDSFRMRTLDGAYLNHGSWPQYSLSSPVFQSTFIQLAQEAVDIGADGFMIDDIADWLGVILYLPAHNAGSFDSVTMAAFRDYLRQKYSSAVLQSQFGISDINSFDFGDYVRANGLADTWNQSPLKGLSIEFFLFKRGENLQFLRTLVATTKQYAQQKYARDILFSCNTTFGTNFLVRDVMDLTTPEAAYIRGHEPGTDHPYMAPDIRAWKGWKGQIGRAHV